MRFAKSAFHSGWTIANCLFFIMGETQPFYIFLGFCSQVLQVTLLLKSVEEWQEKAERNWNSNQANPSHFSRTMSDKI